MTKPKLTVLTDPMPWGHEMPLESARRLGRRAKYLVCKRQYCSHPKYRGHFAVTRSLIEGLKSIGACFNYNPRFPWQLAETVIVLAGVRTLRQAIRYKRAGRLKKLLAGPNIVIFSSDNESILASPEIDMVITPCRWVSDIYAEDHPSLRSKLFEWPAGVDTKYWRPASSSRGDSILVFEKQKKGPVGPIGPYIKFVQDKGWDIRVLRYGTYAHDEYREALKSSCLMVGFVRDESQGLAWLEAWSSDVPTLLWRNSVNESYGRRYECSTAPYLNSDNGLFFGDLEDFVRKFNYWEKHQELFRPRKWVLENMTDEVCAAALYKKAMSL